MATTTYLAALEKALRRADIPAFAAGASGYFSAPSDHLDPALFDGDRIKPEVNRLIQQKVLNFMRARGYARPRDWLTFWIAGSGVSYQWQGDRGNGDLDVLLGVDWPEFYLRNPDWLWSAPDVVTDYLDTQLRAELWPKTAHTEINGKTFELTVFVSKEVGADIRVIHPYAAYNLTTVSWDVRPPQLPEDPTMLYPPEWFEHSKLDVSAAIQVRMMLESDLSQAQIFVPGSPHWINCLNHVENYAKVATDILEDIHQGRRVAFQSTGQGYGDYHNFRWQRAKQTGVVAVLSAIEHARRQAIEAAETATYGAPLATADEMITRAAMAHRDMR